LARREREDSIHKGKERESVLEVARKVQRRRRRKCARRGIRALARARCCSLSDKITRQARRSLLLLKKKKKKKKVLLRD